MNKLVDVANVVEIFDVFCWHRCIDSISNFTAVLKMELRDYSLNDIKQKKTFSENEYLKVI